MPGLFRFPSIQGDLILTRLDSDAFLRNLTHKPMASPFRLVLDNEEEEDDPVIMYLNVKADLHQSFWTLKKSKFFLIPPNF